MSSKITKFAKGFFIKIFMFLIVLSFVGWGIGDILRSNTQDPVAEIGDYELTPQEFDQLLRQNRRQQPGMTPVDLMRQIVKRQLLELEIKDQGLQVGEMQLVERVKALPDFRDESEQFSLIKFQTILQQNNIKEEEFLRSFASDLSIGHIMDVFNSIEIVPEALVSSVFERVFEDRVVDMLVIKPSYVRSVDEPTETDLIPYYEEHKKKFKAPEYRTLRFLSLDEKNVKDEIEVSEEELQATYEEQKDNYFSPEMRDVLHMVFDSEDEANKAHAELTKGTAFKEVAKQFDKADPSTISLGFISREDLFEGLDKIVFAQIENSFSEPQESSLGWHLFYVSKIQPEQVQPFAKVKNELKDYILEGRVNETLYHFVNQLEDSLAAGTSLDEMASSFKLNVTTLPAVDRQGNTSASKKASSVSFYQELVAQGFDLNEGETSTFILSENNGAYFVVHVDKVVPSRERALDEVRAKVVKDWKKFRKEEKLKEQAGQLLDDLRAGKTMDAAAKNKSISLKRGKRIHSPYYQKKFDFRDEDKAKRYTDVEPQVTQGAFSLADREFTEPIRQKDGTYVIAELIKIIPMERNVSPVSKRLVQEELEQSFSQDILEQYLLYLQKKYPVSINYNALNTDNAL